MISIPCIERKETSKGGLRRLRRRGFIPCVVYSKGSDVFLSSLPKADFERGLRTIRPGFITTSIFLLKDESGKERKALVREIQYHPTSYEVLHIDFMELSDAREVVVKVPIDVANAVDCVGIKLGGQLRQVLRHVPVRCLPQAIPSHFVIDLRDVGIHQSRRVRDLVIPTGIVCLACPNDVLVCVNK